MSFAEGLALRQITSLEKRVRGPLFERDSLPRHGLDFRRQGGARRPAKSRPKERVIRDKASG